MNKEVASFESIIDKQKGFLEMGSHFIAGDIKSIDNFMIDLCVFGILYSQHSSSRKH